MSVRLRDLLTAGMGELRQEPLPRRLRGVLAGATVVDSTRAVLVWEPKRLLPAYAVPVADIAADLVPDGVEAPAYPGEKCPGRAAGHGMVLSRPGGGPHAGVSGLTASRFRPRGC